MNSLRFGRAGLLVAATALLALAGCGSGRYRVSGVVTYEDGSPLTEGTVAGEATIDGKLVAVQGSVQKDGKFDWGTERPGDGAYPGTYRVIVLPRALGDAEISEGKLAAVEKRFTSYATSNITFDVKSGVNTLNIKVTKPATQDR